MQTLISTVEDLKQLPAKDIVPTLESLCAGAWSLDHLDLNQRVDIRNFLFNNQQLIQPSVILMRFWASLEADLGMYAVSVEILARVATSNAERANWLKEMGLSLSAQGKHTQALSCFEQGVELAPDDWTIWNDGGCMLRALGRSAESAEWMKQAIECLPDNANLHANLALIYYEQHAFELAQASLNSTFAIDADNPEALHTQGMLYARLGKLREAREFELRALQIKPNYPQVRLSLALLDLLRGNWKAGFAGYESRWTGSDKADQQAMPHIGRPQWSGHKVYPGSRIAVLPEQGLGDHLQFARFVPLLLEHFNHVDWVVPQPLYNLFRNSFTDKAISLHADTTTLNLPLIDFQIPLMSLPLALGITLDNLPAPQRYIVPSAALIPRFESHFDSHQGRKKIGLAWSGRPTLAAHALRKLDPAMLSKLNHPTACFVNLQKHEKEGDDQRPKMTHWVDCMADCPDFDHTAALVQHLDLVITTDTSIAHLAGAMGKPVWMLNRIGSEWRWLHGRTDSPWYPSMTLFNQEDTPDWSPVLLEVRRQLHASL